MLRAIFTLALLTLPLTAQEKPTFALGPDSNRQEGVPTGKVTRHEWSSEVLKGTMRQWYLYVPAQYDGSKPAAVMIFQDGHAYVGEKGDLRVPVVFDNLIHKGVMPVTIGVFLNPGWFTDKIEGTQGWQNPRKVNYTRCIRKWKACRSSWVRWRVPVKVRHSGSTSRVGDFRLSRWCISILLVHFASAFSKK